MIPLLEEILRTGQVFTIDRTEAVPVHSAITADAGEFLQNLIAERKPKTTLEIGLAYGVSALFICEALQKCGGAKHIAIDPNQSTDFRGIGLNNLRLAGFADFVELRELPAHLALPQLEAQGATVEFAFIDGWHTFDHALTDFFHVDRILATGGVVVFDDAFFPGVHQACRFVATNRSYRFVGSTEKVADYRASRGARVLRWTARTSALARKLLKPKFFIPDEELGFTPDCRCVAFEKVSSDSRSWADHHEF
jgi:predicted O-methyltransferase YrrM